MMAAIRTLPTASSRLGCTSWAGSCHVEHAWIPNSQTSSVAGNIDVETAALLDFSVSSRGTDSRFGVNVRITLSKHLEVSKAFSCEKYPQSTRTLMTNPKLHFTLRPGPSTVPFGSAVCNYKMAIMAVCLVILLSTCTPHSLALSVLSLSLPLF